MVGELLAWPVVRFFIVGGAVYLLGMGLLAVLVEWLKVGKSLANLLMLLFTLQVSFLLNNFWSFESLPSAGFGELGQRWFNYHLVRLIPLTLEQTVFVWLIRRWRWPYLLASALVIVAGFIAVYLGSVIFVFR